MVLSTILYKQFTNSNIGLLKYKFHQAVYSASGGVGVVVAGPNCNSPLLFGFLSERDDETQLKTLILRLI